MTSKMLTAILGTGLAATAVLAVAPLAHAAPATDACGGARGLQLTFGNGHKQVYCSSQPNARLADMVTWQPINGGTVRIWGTFRDGGRYEQQNKLGQCLAEPLFVEGFELS